MADTTQPIFCRSPTVAAAFLFTGASAVPSKSTKFAGVVLGVVPGTVPCGVVSTDLVFSVEPTPVICVGLPSLDVIFNAEDGCASDALFVAGFAASAFIVTGLTGVTGVVVTSTGVAPGFGAPFTTSAGL